MCTLSKSLATWGRPDFEAVFKAELPKLGSELPLQKGLAAGSYALEDSLNIMIIQCSETEDEIQVKAGIFYESLTPGCACAGDPTVESEQNEHITVLVGIDKQTAESDFQLLDE